MKTALLPNLTHRGTPLRPGGTGAVGFEGLLDSAHQGTAHQRKARGLEETTVLPMTAGAMAGGGLGVEDWQTGCFTAPSAPRVRWGFVKHYTWSL